LGKIIAITGKGGTGKTAVAAMLIRYLVKDSGKKYRVLVIDADADANLADALGVKAEKTIGDMREFMQQSRYTTPPETDKQVLFESKLFEILLEEDGYDLLVMGKPEGSGCYCFVNNLLRAVMDKTVANYDLVIIDTPAVWSTSAGRPSRTSMTSSWSQTSQGEGSRQGSAYAIWPRRSS